MQPPAVDADSAQIRAEELLAAQYTRMQQNGTSAITHPFPAYPNATFTWSACNGSANPYLIITVRDQQVRLLLDVLQPQGPRSHDTNATSIKARSSHCHVWQRCCLLC